MKRNRKLFTLVFVPVVFFFCTAEDGCESKKVQSVSGTQMVTAGKVQTNPEGKTVEQANITKRIDMDNLPGSTKHLYVLSAYSGQVLIYSTVKGKVTSSGKRLTPDRVLNWGNSGNVFSFGVAGSAFYTDQVLGEDGTYGSSIEYLYWWDTKGVYHQHYIQGGQILHVSDQPLAVKSIVINMEISQKQE